MTSVKDFAALLFWGKLIKENDFLEKLIALYITIAKTESI